MSFFNSFYTYNTDSDDLPTSPTSPTTPTTPNSDTLNSHTPNFQRRASESIAVITESTQFKKAPTTRRNTLPSRLFASKLWESGRDSSVQVAMENVQFGV